MVLGTISVSLWKYKRIKISLNLKIEVLSLKEV